MTRTALLLALSLSLAAHDLYLKPAQFTLAAGAKSAVEFHNGESFPSSDVPPVLERLRDTEVVTPSGKTPLANVRIQGKAGIADFVAPAAPAFFLTARTIPNFIELDARKFDEYLHHENLNSIAKWRAEHGESNKPGREMYSKYVKALVHTGAPSDFATKPIGMPIEFVPLVDPATLQPGAVLTVRVLLRGKPAPGLPVEASSFSNGKRQDRQLGPTDSNGLVKIPLDVSGIWKLHSIHMERRADTRQAEWESFWASLTFEIPTQERK